MVASDDTDVHGQSDSRPDRSRIRKALHARYVDVALDDAQRLLAFLAHSHIPNRKRAFLIGALLDIVDDPAVNPALRGSAVEAISNQLPSKQRRLRRKAIIRLLPRLSDDEPEVRFWSAFALGQLGARLAKGPLTRLASDRTMIDGWWAVGDEAADALERLAGREAPDRVRSPQAPSADTPGASPIASPHPGTEVGTSAVGVFRRSATSD